MRRRLVLPIIGTALALTAIGAGLLLFDTPADAPSAVGGGLEVTLACGSTPVPSAEPGRLSSSVDPLPATFDWDEGSQVFGVLLLHNGGDRPVDVRGMAMRWDGPPAINLPLTARFDVEHDAIGMCGGPPSSSDPSPWATPLRIAPGDDGFVRFTLTEGHCNGLGGEDGTASMGVSGPSMEAVVEQDGASATIAISPWPQLTFRSHGGQCPLED